MEETSSVGWIGWVAVASAVVAALLLIGYLIKRPALVATTKLGLLMALGVFPILSATTANIAGFQATQSRKFCGSCHVMGPYESDSNDAHSTSLSSIHGRNHHFGHDNCYTCHKDYGMYGYVLTKMGGMRHVYMYLTEYHSMPLEQSRHDIHILKPVPNDNCMSCHTATAPRWLQIPDHAASVALVKSDALSCSSPGCHGYAHPFSKLPPEQPAVQP